MLCVATLATACCCAIGPAGATSPSTAAGDTSSWTVYHGDPAGSGTADGVTAVDTNAPAWTSSVLDGELYGEPLVSSGHVYVATENDTFYALSSTNGAVVWSAHVGTPVPSSALSCGDITPTVGITGTPVIDQARSEIFAVADELIDGKPAHMLVGLSTATGKVELAQDVDPSGSVPADLLQRTGLTLDAGQVVFGMGGNDGDCATYRGRVIAVPEAGGTPTTFTIDDASGENQGAVWMGGGAPAVDGNGNIWVSVGNGSVYSASHAYDDSDSVLELSSALTLVSYFAPTSWPQNNQHDLDMSTVPALLSDGQVVLAGKSRIVYLLNGSDLGDIGGQEASLGAACSEDIDGGIADVGTTVYLPCYSGTIAVQVTQSPPALTLLWSAVVGGGPPIVAAGLVWTIGHNGVLYGLDATTGKVQQQASIGIPANHFPTPGVGDGLFLTPAADRVVAFTATSSASSITSSTTTTAAPAASATTAPASPSRSSSGGGITAADVVAIFAAGLVLLSGARWLYRRTRTRRTG
jgi:outer membrane protein assembly factor BamB